MNNNAPWRRLFDAGPKTWTYLVEERAAMSGAGEVGVWLLRYVKNSYWYLEEL